VFQKCWLLFIELNFGFQCIIFAVYDSSCRNTTKPGVKKPEGVGGVSRNRDGLTSGFSVIIGVVERETIVGIEFMSSWNWFGIRKCGAFQLNFGCKREYERSVGEKKLVYEVNASRWATRRWQAFFNSLEKANLFASLCMLLFQQFKGPSASSPSRTSHQTEPRSLPVIVTLWLPHARTVVS